MTWMSPEEFAGGVGQSSVRPPCTENGPFCSFVNLSERVAPLDSSPESMQSGLITDLAAKLTRLPIIFIRNNPSFFSKSCLIP